MKDEIVKLQEKFDQAEKDADKEALNDLIADDFLSIGPKGFVLNKQEWIDRHAYFKYLHLETSEIDVSLYDNTAIVRNIQRNIGDMNGRQVKVATRVSQVWVKQKDKWKLAAIQFSPLVDENSTI